MLYSYSMTSGTTTAKAESYVRAFMAYIRGGGGVSNNGLAGSVLISTGPSITFEGQCMCDTTSGCGACNTAVSYIQKTVLASPTCGSGSAWLQTCSTATQVHVAHTYHCLHIIGLVLHMELPSVDKCVPTSER